MHTSSASSRGICASALSHTRPRASIHPTSSTSRPTPLLQRCSAEPLPPFVHRPPPRIFLIAQPERPRQVLISAPAPICRQAGSPDIPTPQTHSGHFHTMNSDLLAKHTASRESRPLDQRHGVIAKAWQLGVRQRLVLFGWRVRIWVGDRCKGTWPRMKLCRQRYYKALCEEDIHGAR